MSPLVDGQSAVSTLRKWRQRRHVATGIRATALLAERASQYLVIVSPSFTEQLRVWPHVPPPFRFPGNIHGIERFGWGLCSTPSFRFWGSAISERLGRVTVLPQLKVDRLCPVIDGTAEFDPKPTSDALRRSKHEADEVGLRLHPSPRGSFHGGQDAARPAHRA